MLFLLLSGAIFGACSSDKDRVPVFVKNVVMPPDSWVFAPGDGVTVSAEGFEADDEIMLEIHWQESAEGFAPEGYAKGVRGIIIPATMAVYKECILRGWTTAFIDAGCIVSTPTCGPCLGGYMGILAAGERCVSTTNRNFVGRMGHVDSEVYLASPATAAASALTGYITDPRTV